MKQSLAPVISSTEVTPGVYLAWLESPWIASTARPGQFVMVRCGEESVLRRPLSIHQVDSSKTCLALLFKVVGKGTGWLSGRQAGDTLDLLGPLGNGYHILPTSHHLLLVAGGIGIAPLGFLADEAVKQKKKVTLLMGAASAVHLLPEPTAETDRGLLTQGVLPWGITIHKTTDDGSDGHKGLVTELLIDQQHIDWADQVFACGPALMYNNIADQLRLKAKPLQISLEERMGCGLGVCYGCTVKTKSGLKQVCKDGPVFDLDDIIWNELK